MFKTPSLINVRVCIHLSLLILFMLCFFIPPHLSRKVWYSWLSLTVSSFILLLYVDVRTHIQMVCVLHYFHFVLNFFLSTLILWIIPLWKRDKTCLNCEKMCQRKKEIAIERNSIPQCYHRRRRRLRNANAICHFKQVSLMPIDLWFQFQYSQKYLVLLQWIVRAKIRAKYQSNNFCVYSSTQIC